SCTYTLSLHDALPIFAHVKRMPASADNVTAAIAGRTDASLPPLVVMTPRSGWYRCASERGGGIAVWLEMMRALQRSPLKRPVWRSEEHTSELQSPYDL